MIKLECHFAIANELMDVGIDHQRLLMLKKRETTRLWVFPKGQTQYHL